MKQLYLLALCVVLVIACTLAQEEYKAVEEVKGLQLNEQVADFSAVDIYKQTYNLEETLKEGPVVLVFIRGEWCPFCNRHLEALQDSLSLINDKGASIVVVSPEKPEYLEKNAQKSGVRFSLLYDEGYKIANAFDVAFLPDETTRKLYDEKLGVNLKERHSDKSERLPVPATFIIGQDFKIKWRHFDPDYKNRSRVADILENIPAQ